MLEVVERGENTKTIRIGQREVQLNREDPHGFWFFKWNVGSPPEVLQQAFTGSRIAMEHLENWWNTSPANIEKPLPEKKPKITIKEVSA